MAQTPPPFQMPPPAAPATNSANRACLIIVLLLLAFCVVGGVIVFFFMRSMWGQLSSTLGCMATFELSNDATIAYAREHNGKLPSADKWQDEIKPYYERLYKKMSAEIQDAKMLEGFLPPPTGSVLQCKWENRTTGIAYNRDVAGKKLADIKEPTKTVLFFETDESALNLTRPYKEMPKAKAPKIMNSARDWIVYYVEGNNDPFETSGGSTDMDISPEDAMTPENEKAGGTKTGNGQ